MNINSIQKELEIAHKLVGSFLSDKSNLKQIEKAGTLMAESITQGGKIISCGNGGSMSDAMHFAEELTGRFRDNRPSLPAIAISDPSFITCAGNDYGYDCIFSRFIEGIGNAKDVLLAISTSGNSVNVLKAAEAAKGKKMLVISLTGKDGGKLAPLSDVNINIPHYEYADRIQEMHIKIIHILIQFIESVVE